MLREQILWGLQSLFWPGCAKFIICAGHWVLTFYVSSPHPLNKRASSLWLNLFHCPSFSILSHGLERRRTCLYCYMCAPFLPFSSHKFLHLFTSVYRFFLLPLVPLFSLSYFSYPIFTRTTFIGLKFYFSGRFIRRDYLLVCFSFHSSQSSRHVRLLSTHVPPYPPPLPPPPPTQSSCYHAYFLSALGWCPLDVISSEISVFLSIDSRSTGVGCRCLLSSILSLQLQL